MYHVSLWVTMSTIIPEIRVYSPSDKGNESNDSDNISGRPSIRSRPRSKAGSLDKDKFAGSPASRSEDASEGTSASHPIGIKIAILRNRGNARHCVVNRPNVELVKWDSTFHSRPGNLSNFSSSFRSAHRSQIIAINRARVGCIASSAKSLDILRQNLQLSINHDIDEILQKYLSKFFQQAIQNIKANNGDNSVSDEHVNAVCRQILEDAKKMYHIIGSSGFSNNQVQGTSPAELSDTENVSEPRLRRYIHKSTVRKRKYSDSDNEAILIPPKPKKRKRRMPLLNQNNMSGRSTPSKIKVDAVKREGLKWDPVRLTATTEFIMGAKANKCLGLGATRGRLYNKHSDVFKYSGDQDDKQWLYDHSLMPATGGKAYMLLVSDIRDLAESEEYKNCPGVSLEEIIGFCIPDFMLVKMKAAMTSMRTDIPQPTRKRQRNILAISDALSDRGSVLTDQKSEETGREEESRTASPMDDLDLLSADLQSADPSPFSMVPGFEDVSPGNPDGSPVASDLSCMGMDAPLSAPFDITEHSLKM